MVDTRTETEQVRKAVTLPPEEDIRAAFIHQFEGHPITEGTDPAKRLRVSSYVKSDGSRVVNRTYYSFDMERLPKINFSTSAEISLIKPVGNTTRFTLRHVTIEGEKSFSTGHNRDHAEIDFDYDLEPGTPQIRVLLQDLRKGFLTLRYTYQGQLVYVKFQELNPQSQEVTNITTLQRHGPEDNFESPNPQQQGIDTSIDHMIIPSQKGYNGLIIPQSLDIDYIKSDIVTDDDLLEDPIKTPSRGDRCWRGIYLPDIIGLKWL